MTLLAYKVWNREHRLETSIGLLSSELGEPSKGEWGIVGAGAKTYVLQISTN